LEYSCVEPALGLLVHSIPRRQVIRHHAPLSSTSDYPSQPIEHLSQAVLPLRSVFGHQRQVRGDERPLIIGYIAWVWLFTLSLFVFHTPILPTSLSEVHNRL